MWGGILERDGDTVGYGFISLLAGHCWIHDLAHRGPELEAVSILFTAGLEAAKAKGIKKVRTEVLPGSSTHKLYLKLGWKETMMMEGEI